MKDLFVTFEELGLKKPILEALHAQGYETPTPIQAQAIPVIMQGRDIIGLAQTGTGKTAAFLLPLLHYLSGDSRPRQQGEARVLILSPTRELATQIHNGVRDYSSKLATRSCVVMGGVSIKPQLKKMQAGVDILVATPGRLEDLEKQGGVDLRTVEAIVLDEADQMLDIGFMPAIKRIMAKCKNINQRLLFSATMPKEILQLTKQYLKNPQEVAVATVSKTADKIDQKVMHVNAGVKISAAIHILSTMAQKRVIVFTRTKRGADRVVRRLKHEKLEAAAIHGDKSQNQREKALNAFKNGECNILIATDIAARGIDVRGIDLVINYDLPQVAEAYVHRIGRTARAGASGLAITICAAEEREMLKKIERLIKLNIPVMETPRGLAMPEPLAKLPRGPRPNKGGPRGKQGGPRREPNKPRSNSRRPKKSLSELALEAERDAKSATDAPNPNARPGKKNRHAPAGPVGSETGAPKKRSGKPRWRGKKSGAKAGGKGPQK